MNTRQSVVSQHDLVYKTPPRVWQDGFPIGNGHFGGMVWQPEDPDRITIGITKLDVWDHRHGEMNLVSFDRYRGLLESDPEKAVKEIYDEPDYSAPYPSPKPCGRLTIGIDEGFLPLNATLRDQRQLLKLHSATIECEYEISTKSVKVAGFVSAQKNILAIRVSNTWVHSRFKGDQSQTITLEREIDELLGIPEVGEESGNVYIRYRFPDGFEYVMAARVVGEVSRSEPLALPERVSVTADLGAPAPGRSYDVFLTVVTSLDSDNPREEAIRALHEVSSTGYDELHEAHKTWWAGFWNASAVEIEDRFLEGLWYFSLYQLASTCRGETASGLFGLWNMSKSPQWHGDYHGDYNISMAHWFLFSSNHLELGEPFFTTFSSLLPIAKAQTKEHYQIDGAKFPIATGPVTGLEITRTYYRMMIVSSAYYVIPFWWRYTYSMDKKYLEDVAFPIIEESAKFYLALTERTDSGLRIGPSWSPEQGPLPAYNVTNDLSLIKVVWSAYLEACTLLAKTTQWMPRVKTYLSEFPEYPVAEGKFLDSSSATLDLKLAHTGLFSMIYPAGEIDADHRLASTAEETIETYHERAQRLSFVGRSSLSDVQAWTTQALGLARLRKPERVDHYLVDVGLSEYLKSNGMITIISNGLFDTAEEQRRAFAIGDEPRAHHVIVASGTTREGRDRHFQFLEGPSALLCIINEMMLQSHSGVIRIFPSLPERIKNCSFVTLRAEGAFLVSGRCRNGLTERVEIKSLAGQRCSVRLFRYDQTSMVCAESGEESIDAEHNGVDTWSFDTIQGGDYTLTVAGMDDPVGLEPFRDSGEVDKFTDCYGAEIFYGKP